MLDKNEDMQYDSVIRTTEYREARTMQNTTDQTNPAQKILLAAYDCLSTRGYANVTMRNIADEAGVALSQLTYYFKNKERLFTEVISKMAGQYIHEIETRLRTAADLNEKIASLTQFFKEMLQGKPKLLKLFIDFAAQAMWIPSFREQVDSLFGSLTLLIEKCILNDTAAHQSKPMYSANAIAKLILGALFGTSVQTLLSADKDDAFESFNLAEILMST